MDTLGDIFGKGLDAWVDVERVRNYQPNAPQPYILGPDGYAYPAGTGAAAVDRQGGGSLVPWLLVAALAVGVLFFALRR
ncbi:MAG: hypothetical protein U1F72_05740 [Gammaproteobacteria bacterium]